MNRRNFIQIAASGLLVGAGAYPIAAQSIETHYQFGYLERNYLRPPGALPESEFLTRCINCGVCGELCPRGTIKFFTGSLEGEVQPHTPYILAADVGCDLCLECTQGCPTGALTPLENKRDVNMGLAVIEENLCLPYIRQGICGACYTICPTRAIRLEMQRHPKVKNDKCVGCGLCEEVCLQKVKAIRVLKT